MGEDNSTIKIDPKRVICDYGYRPKLKQLQERYVIPNDGVFIPLKTDSKYQ